MATPGNPTSGPQGAANTPPPKDEGPKILRIGVIQAGKIVEERLIRRREDVTIGASARNNIVVPASTLPRSYTLFELSHGQYHLVFSDQMDGRVSVGGQVMALDQVRNSGKAQPKGKNLLKLPLTDTARGKILLGEVTLLFQFVAPPPVQPRPQLPPSVRGSVVGQMDWPLAYSFIGNFAAIAGMVLYLHSMDIETRVAADVIPDDFVQYVPTVEEPKPQLDMTKLAKVGEEKVKKVAKKTPGAGAKRKSKGKGKGPKKDAPPCDADCQAARAEARRARLLEKVSRMGALKILGA
jgi:hypothetical protein